MSVDDGLRALFRKHLKGFHWQSVETGFTSRGVPDSNYCSAGAEGWIEFKSVRRGWSVRVRPEQVAWLLIRQRHGGRTFIAVRRRTGAEDELWIYRGDRAKDIADLGLTAPRPLLVCGGGPGAWGWNEVARILTS